MLDFTKYEQIGLRIREGRESLKLSRKHLAKLIGASPYYIGQIERGERKMSMDTIIDISRCLHLSVDYMLTGRGPKAAGRLLCNDLYHQDHGASCDEKMSDEAKEVEALKREINELTDRCSKQELEVVADVLKLIIPHI